MKKDILLTNLILLSTVAVSSTLESSEQRCYKFSDEEKLLFLESSTPPLSNDSNALFPDLQLVYIDPVIFKF
ncbi:hypothetical protein C1N51_27765 (plasmid) [Vibrio campbellii]|nr:hypothetical protein C1N51_27765 [Vibrio campbellii]